MNNTSDDRDLGCLETFTSIRREHLGGGKTVHYFAYTFKDGIDPDAAEQTATGLSIAHFLGRAV